MKPEHPLIAIIGPTAVGKTSVSIELARRMDGEIISADSRLVYRGMDIGTAKPTVEERSIVPHHLIDIVDPSETYSLAEYRKAALAVIGEVHQRGRLPFLVGGTGQYIRAVLEGWVPPPRPDDFSFRRRMEQWAEEHGHRALHDRLRRLDPARAAAIDPRNVRRVIRALEIYEITGVPPSKLRVKVPPPFEVLQIGLIRPREELYERIDQRIDDMLAAGWLEEIEKLMDQG
ncbi:MAG: tRNA (adenosine(37)-N6)-dimethylallyltransferase MiaA, partial [Anaerolineales bacterium]